MYLALNANGTEYPRPELTVGELPFAERLPALARIAALHGLGRIPFGQRLYVSLGMTKREAEHDGRAWLLKAGEDLPLSLLAPTLPDFTHLPYAQWAELQAAHYSAQEVNS